MGMKGKRWIFILAALVLLAGAGSRRALAAQEVSSGDGVLSQAVPASANPEESPLAVTGLEVSIEWGGSETIRIGRETPVTVQVKSSGPEIHGYASIYVPVGNGSYYVVEEELSVAAGETKQAVLCVPMNYSLSKFWVEYRDADGTLYASRSYSLTMGYGSQEVYIAAVGSRLEVLENMTLFDRVPLNEYQGTSTRLYRLEAAEVPSDEKLFKIYDILLWTDVDAMEISQAQLTALQNWVYEGGILIVGRNSDLCIPLAEGELARERWGQGLYIYSGFALEKIGDYYADETEIRSFLYEAVGTSRMNSLEESLRFGYEEYWSARTMTSNVDPARIPQVWQYALILGIYLVLLGPVLYLLLKKKGRQGMLRGAMVGLAFFFTAIVYLVGGQTRFTRPFMNYAAIREIRDEGIRETIFTNISSPYNIEYSFTVDERYTLTPLLSFDSYDDPVQTGKDSCRLRVCQGEDEVRVTVNDEIAFTPELMRLGRMEENEGQAGFEGEMQLFDGEVAGWLQNTSGRDYERVCILAGGRLFLLGEMAAGQRKELSAAETVVVPGYGYYDACNRIAGFEANSRAGESKEAALASWRTTLVSYYTGLMLTMDKEEATILAFPRTEEITILRNSDIEVRGTTMETALLTVDFTRDGLVYVPCLAKEPVALQGNYDAADNSTYVRQLVLQYDFEKLQVERLYLEWPEVSDSANAARLFEGSIEFFNWKTKTYDQIEQKGTYTAEEIADYLDRENCLTIRYVSNIAEEYSYEQLLPRIAATGRE